MIAYEGDVKLTDFGIAKALDLMYNEEGKVIAGKDEYLSPEQASYAVTDARADLFPLGIVLTELLLGKNLFRSTTAPSRAATSSRCRSRSSRPAPTSTPGSRPSSRRALQRDRDKRYQSPPR
jgi:serine/threonine protein kinase